MAGKLKGSITWKPYKSADFNEDMKAAKAGKLSKKVPKALLSNMKKKARA